MASDNNQEKKMSGWMQSDTTPKPDDEEIKLALIQLTQPVFLLDLQDKLAVGKGRSMTVSQVRPQNMAKHYPLAAYAPALAPHHLGDRQFRKRYGLRYAYIVGAMANGITSVEMVETVGRNGMLGFFGAAGLTLDKVEEAIVRLQNCPEDFPYGFNLVHSPNVPDL